MDPNDLRERVQGEIAQYIDAGDWEQHQRVERTQRETVKKIAARMMGAAA